MATKSPQKARRTRTKPLRSTKKPAAKKTFRLDKIFLGGVGHLLKGLQMVGGAALVAYLTTEEEIEAAGGDVVEAANGHRCGPTCWHALGTTDKERQAWWDKKMEDYRKAKVAREAWRKKPTWDPEKFFKDKDDDGAL